MEEESEKRVGGGRMRKREMSCLLLHCILSLNKRFSAF